MVDQTWRDQAGSPDRFGYEWGAYGDLLPEYEEQFRGWAVHLSPGDWRGLSFLDVGCGMGRNSYWPMIYGAREGVAVEIDERSLRNARRNLAAFPNMQVMHASAYELPFENRFDLVFSIGVIHHLENPLEALRRMVRAARPGGRVLMWVYGREGNEWFVSVLDPLRKALFRHLPVSLVHHLSLYPAALLWMLLRCGLRPSKYFELLARLRFPHLRSIVFDQMLPRISHYWRREQVLQLMEQAGLADIRIASVNQMSWSAIGTRLPQLIDHPGRS